MNVAHINLAASIGLYVLICGCNVSSDVETPSPWRVANQFFSTGMTDPSVRTALAGANVLQTFILPERIDHTRYEFMRISRFERMDSSRYAGIADFTIDGWPWSLDFEVAQTHDKWFIHRIASQEEQLRIVSLLGDEGLPEVETAQSWSAGLTGRSEDGRTSAPVVLVVLDGRVFVDGTRPTPYSKGLVIEALKQALEKRQQMAQGAHGHYWPHVALAMTRGTPAVMTVDLAHWAMQAGAEFVQLIVRNKDGSRSWLPVSRTETATADSSPQVVRIRHTPATIILEFAGQGARKRTTQLPAPVTAQKLSRSMSPAQQLSGSLIAVSPLSNYQHLTRLVAQTLRVLPGRPVAFDGGQR